MARPIYNPVFEELETTIENRMLDRVSDEWRKEPGDFIYDTIVPTAPEVKKLQAGQDAILKNSFAQYAEDNYLDYKLAEIGLERVKAVAAKRNINIQADAGVVIPAGHKVSTIVLDTGGNPVEYTVDSQVAFTAVGTRAVAITAKVVGIIGNAPLGSQFLLLPPIPGVRVIADGSEVLRGSDTESDESAYDRYEFKVKHPDTGGNKNDYIRWAQEIDGVGKVQVIPRWSGNGTVKVVLLDPNALPATADVVETVQDYLDPGTTGLGEGKAPCGASVTVVAATNYPINVVVDGILYEEGADHAAVKAAYETAVINYFKNVAFTGYVVSYPKVGGLLVNTTGVVTYVTLTVNGGTADIAVPPQNVAVLGTVTINA